jgi:hypothetical protein
MALSESYILHKQTQRNEHLAFDVEAWFGLLEGITFDTTFIDLHPEVATAIVKFYGARYNHRRAEFTPEHGVLLWKLRDRLEEELKLPAFRTMGAFVRLSSRSPKDGSPFRTIDHERAYQESLSALEKKDAASDLSSLLDGGGGVVLELTAANREMRALSEASSNCWRVRNSDDAMSLILSSERVFVDLNEALICLASPPAAPFATLAPTSLQPPLSSSLSPSPPSPNPSPLPPSPSPPPSSPLPPPPTEWTTRVSVRAWDERLQEAFEFRCFVHQGVLVAMSQYNHYCVYPEVLKVKEEVHALVTAFCTDEVLPRLSEVPAFKEGYIVDVGVVFQSSSSASTSTIAKPSSSSSSSSCVVIELNPYKESTGAALFDWSRDSELLLGCDHSHTTTTAATTFEAEVVGTGESPAADGSSGGGGRGKSSADDTGGNKKDDLQEVQRVMREDGTCVEVGYPPLRLQIKCPPQVPELVAMIKPGNNQDGREGEGAMAETYLDVLASLSGDEAGGNGQEKSGGRCVCQ